MASNASNISNTGVPTAASPAPQQTNTKAGSNRLGAFLCWAVVFADIGTSVYYVPGILYTEKGIGRLAGLFVIMTLVVFLLLALKYAEVSVRFPEGGGVVTVAAHGLNPWAGAVGGMFILVDYFLTSSISSLSGLEYFQTIIPSIAPYVLIITIAVLILLGILNWYGIKESAIFSATIAVAAFISDMLILLFVALRVPPHIIGMVFQEMFSGRHLSIPIALTGFAGAFLAFSGLESISQLSPVMKTPRHKTVTWALAFVVITVGITSPLLTVFSTTLLTDPVILHATHTTISFPHGKPDPSQLISELGLAYGGNVLAILTAVTASILLIFASNTAIIGAYHVFLALSRMRFFPKIVEFKQPHLGSATTERGERRSFFSRIEDSKKPLRDTPLVSIILATAIPILVLIAVAGKIDILGDMYAFGLLGAFSLTCLSLDVIRWRERRGEIVAPVHSETNEPDDYADSPFSQATAALRARFGGVRRQSTPLLAVVKAQWPNIKYYLGFVTTFLVGIAWITNLKAKPLATAFGGGMTILGLGIMVVYYLRQERAGVAPVFLSQGMRRQANALLVVLTTASKHNQQVIQAATGSADGHSLIYLYLGNPADRPIQRMEVYDPYQFDIQAQDTLSSARTAARHNKVPVVDYLYRTGGVNAVLDAWRIIRPDEIIADADTAKAISTKVAPQYIRFQQVDGVRVAHYVKHYVEGLGNTPLAGNGTATKTLPPKQTTPPTDSSIPAASKTGYNGVGKDNRDNGHRANGKATADVGQLRNTFAAPESQSANGNGQGKNGNSGQVENSERPPASTTQQANSAISDIPDETPAEDTQPSGSVDVSDYVWTGTALVRRDELPANTAQEAPATASNEAQEEPPAEQITAQDDTAPSAEAEHGEHGEHSGNGEEN